MNWNPYPQTHPKTDSQHGNMWLSDEVLLDLGDCYTVDRYFYNMDTKEEGWVFLDHNDNGLVEAWIEILKTKINYEKKY